MLRVASGRRAPVRKSDASTSKYRKQILQGFTLLVVRSSVKLFHSFRFFASTAYEFPLRRMPSCSIEQFVSMALCCPFDPLIHQLVSSGTILAFRAPIRKPLANTRSIEEPPYHRLSFTWPVGFQSSAQCIVVASVANPTVTHQVFCCSVPYFIFSSCRNSSNPSLSTPSLCDLNSPTASLSPFSFVHCPCDGRA